MATVGVDEAGKGPVLGSMFAAAVRWPDDRNFPAGLADSKQLSPERREALDQELRGTDGAAVALAEVPVERIDDPETDMNGLTVAAHARAVGAVVRPGDVVRGDAADVDANRYAARLADALSTDGIDVTGEHRADERHHGVAAASVVAKVARDAHVAELADAYGAVGSGYPSDPATVEFLEAYVDETGRLPECARASWATSERVLAAAEQADLGGF
ncbi:MAG: ribonuclease HII [Halobacteriales archaeon]|nr:ribonuclease HII [Halobacteriales archaeon]